jgi:PTH2 family peptidyl-tRNA hydrolase
VTSKERVFKYKQVIVVRSDLKMSKGKTAVQVAHGSVTAADRVRKTNPEIWKAWFSEGQKKVAVKVDSEDEIMRLQRVASFNDITSAMIRDAGMTELPPGTTTVIGIGPADSVKVDKVTGDLKLL